MRLSVTPVPRRVSQEDLSIALHEITMRLSNETLRELSRTPLWSSISPLTQDQTWWFARTEWLVGRVLTSRIGNWSRVYKSLALYGLAFDVRHNYRSTILVQVLLEIGANPSENRELLGNVARDGNAEALSLLLADPRTDVTGYRYNPILTAIDTGHPAALEVLLADGRIDPGEDDNLPLQDATSAHETECVRLLLTDPRVDPSDRDNKALLTAAKYGYADIVELLLADDRVRDKEDDIGEDDYGLGKAVLGSHVAVVRLILEEEELQFLNWNLIEACKGSSFETVNVLFDDPRTDPSVSNNSALRMARNRRRRDVEELLLSDPRVRAVEDKQRRGENPWEM